VVSRPKEATKGLTLRCAAVVKVLRVPGDFRGGLSGAASQTDLHGRAFFFFFSFLLPPVVYLHWWLPSGFGFQFQFGGFIFFSSPPPGGWILPFFFLWVEEGRSCASFAVGLVWFALLIISLELASSG
jgi:hypothetical protein